MGDLRNAFDSSISESSLIRPVDAALVEAGRKVADQIDKATAMGEGQEVTKALYLVPHLVNILKEMLATPAARRTAGVDDREGPGGKLALLQSAQRKRRPA